VPDKKNDLRRRSSFV